MKKLILLLVLSAVMAGGTCTVSAQSRGTASKTITTTKLANVQETREVVESYMLDAGYEMLVMPTVAEVEVIADGTDSGGRKSYSHKTFEGSARLDGLTGREYTVEKLIEGKRMYVDFEVLKSLVIYDFCRETGADLIVMPQFSARHKTHKVTATDADGNTVQVDEPVEKDGKYVMIVDMIGYPARYTGFRVGNAGDSWVKTLFRQGRISSEDGTLHVENEIVTKQK